MANPPVTSNKWHYPRIELAQKYLTILDTGLTRTIALFARRRTGKTEFISHDLLPQAELNGAYTYTVDFWANETLPEECIVTGVMQTFHELPIRKKLKGQPLKEFQAGLSGLSASVGKPSISTINQAFELMRQIHAKDKVKVILFLDEIQHLATRTEFSPVASALRTFIDKNKPWLNVVFTGSSQDGLKRLFTQKKSAFYDSVSILDFPLLGSDYVAYTVEEFNKFTSKTLNLSEALRVFNKVNGSPDKFGQLIQMLLNNKSAAIEAIYQENKEALNDDYDVATRWEALSDIDSSVLGMIIDKIESEVSYGLYSKSAYLRVKGDTGLEVVTKSTIQNSIDRLRAGNWIFSAGHGKWSLEDETDMAFIKSQIRD